MCIQRMQTEYKQIHNRYNGSKYTTHHIWLQVHYIEYIAPSTLHTVHGSKYEAQSSLIQMSITDMYNTNTY